MSLYPFQCKEGVYGANITLKHRCSCGAEQEIVMYTPEAGDIAIDFNILHTGYLKLAMRYGVVQMNGVHVQDSKLLCKSCGKNVLYPMGIEKKEGN